MSRRQFATDEQVRAAAARAKAVGIERPAAITLHPNGAVTLFDASLARRFATEADHGAEALAERATRLTSMPRPGNDPIT